MAFGAAEGAPLVSRAAIEAAQLVSPYEVSLKMPRGHTNFHGQGASVLLTPTASSLLDQVPAVTLHRLIITA